MIVYVFLPQLPYFPLISTNILSHLLTHTRLSERFQCRSDAPSTPAFSQCLRLKVWFIRGSVYLRFPWTTSTQVYLTFLTGHVGLKSWLRDGRLHFYLQWYDNVFFFFSPFTLCNEESFLLHICWKQSFSVMHPSHSLPLSATLPTHTHTLTHTQSKPSGCSSLQLAPRNPQKWTARASSPPHSTVSVAAALPVSVHWSAGYSLNLWVLHNL